MLSFNGLEISNRFIASSAFKYGFGWDFTENPYSYACIKTGLMDINDFGAFTTKTITEKEWGGFYVNRFAPWKVIRIYPGKIHNRIGWSNCGIKKFINNHLLKLGAKIGKCIVNIGALYEISEIFRMIEKLDDHDILGIELNISCHNVNLAFLKEKGTLEELFSGARKRTKLPLIVKICAESDYVMIAKIAENEGINLIHAINTTLVYSEVLGGYCGQSSYKNKEIALRVISDLRKNNISDPIIGGSGIWTLKDVRDYEGVGANLFSSSHQFIPLPFWPGMLAKKYEKQNR